MMVGVFTSFVAETFRRLVRWSAKRFKNVDKKGLRLAFLLHAIGLVAIVYGVFMLYIYTIQAPPL